MVDLRFGEFDGDGLTRHLLHAAGTVVDLVRAHAGLDPGAELVQAHLGALFGEFDDARGTDVVGVNAGGWQYSDAATLGWAPLNGKLTRSFSAALAADLDGNGKSDILVDVDGEKWQYSRDGRRP
jgi:hypothetical protein